MIAGNAGSGGAARNSSSASLGFLASRSRWMGAAAESASLLLGSGFRNQVRIEAVEITYDPQKHERNLRERGLGFDEAAGFDFLSALYFSEVRKGENRMVAVGHVGRRLHVLCFIPTRNGIRVISFRRANDREARKYGKPKTIDG